MAGRMGARTLGLNRGTWLLALPVLFVLIFFYFPLAAIFSGSLSFGTIFQVLSDPYYRHIIRFTFLQAGLSTVFALLLGLPGAYILSHFRFPGKNIVKGIATVPFVLPSILVVLGFVLFFGNSGILNRGLMALTGRDEPVLRVLYSLWAIILAHGFYNFPISMRIVAAAWEKISRTEIDAASTLGAGRGRVFRTVILPQLLPGMAASSALVFLFCFMSFAVILVLGGGPEFSTLEVEVYRLARFSLDLEKAGVLAFLGSVCSLLVLYGYSRLQHALPSGRVIESHMQMKSLRQGLRGKQGFLLSLYVIIICLLILSPLAAVAVRSFQFRPGWAGSASFSLKWYRELFQTGSGYGRTVTRALVNTLLFGSVTACISVVLGSITAFLLRREKRPGNRLVETFMILPMGVSPVILGLGYLKVLGSLPAGIRGSWIVIVFAHSIVAVPFVIRSVSAVIRESHELCAEAAGTLGASPLRVFTSIHLPLLKPGILAGAAFAFALSAGEMNATIILSSEQTITIPIAMYRLISSYNYYGACALGVLLMLLCLLAFITIEKLGNGAE